MDLVELLNQAKGGDSIKIILCTVESFGRSNYVYIDLDDKYDGGTFVPLNKKCYSDAVRQCLYIAGLDINLEGVESYILE